MRKAVRALVGTGVCAAVIAGAYVAGVAAAPDPADSGVDRPSTPSSVRPTPDQQRARQVEADLPGDPPGDLTGDDAVEEQASDQDAPVARQPRGEPARSPEPEPTRETASAERPPQTSTQEPEPAPEPEPSEETEPEPTDEATEEPTAPAPEPTETGSDGSGGDESSAEVAAP